MACSSSVRHAVSCCATQLWQPADQLECTACGVQALYYRGFHYVPHGGPWKPLSN